MSKRNASATCWESNSHQSSSYWTIYYSLRSSGTVAAPNLNMCSGFKMYLVISGSTRGEFKHQEWPTNPTIGLCCQIQPRHYTQKDNAVEYHIHSQYDKCCFMKQIHQNLSECCTHDMRDCHRHSHSMLQRAHV